MPALALPDHGVKTKHDARGAKVFDPIRRRWLALLPEEWVRQHFINHLVHDLGYPPSLISVERSLILNKLSKRADIVVHNEQGRPILLVECKAPAVRIGQRTFEQAARYNSVFKVDWLMITNGISHYCCVVDHATAQTAFLDHLPNFAELIANP